MHIEHFTRKSEYIKEQAILEFKTAPKLLKYMSNGIQEYRSTGVQEYRSTGVQEYRSTGIQEYRSTGVQEYRSTGVQDSLPPSLEIGSKNNIDQKIFL